MQKVMMVCGKCFLESLFLTVLKPQLAAYIESGVGSYSIVCRGHLAMRVSKGFASWCWSPSLTGACACACNLALRVLAIKARSHTCTTLGFNRIA